MEGKIKRIFSIGIVISCLFLVSSLNVLGADNLNLKTTPGNYYVETYYNKKYQKVVYNCTWYAWERTYATTGIKLPMWGNGSNGQIMLKSRGILLAVNQELNRWQYGKMVVMGM